MDGVIVDLKAAMAKISDYPAHLDTKPLTPSAFAAVGEWMTNHSPKWIEDLFADAPILSDGYKILEFLEDNSVDYSILSAPLPGSSRVATIAGKRRWLNQFGLNHVTAIFTQDKWQYAVCRGKPNYLIDDYYINLQKWRAHGGKPVLYDNNAKEIISLLRAIKQ